MKKFLMFLSVMFIGTAYGVTETINWYVDGSVYDTTTCQTGADIILPATPTKRGYNFTGWEQVFTKLEYIQGTGTQYINTGFIPNQDTSIKTRIQITSLTNLDSVSFLGSNVSYNQRTLALGMWEKHISFGYYNLSHATGINPVAGNIINFDLNKNVGKISIEGGQSQTITGSANNFSCPYPLTIFSTNNPNNYNVVSRNDCGSFRLYYFQIYDDGVLVRDFIPVLAGDTPCLYDKVEQKFYYNPGTDDFIAGPVI